MRIISMLGAAGLAMASLPAVAQTAEAPAAAAAGPVQAATVKMRAPVYDKNGVRIGTVVKVAPTSSGSVDYVTLISGENSVRVPGSTLSMADDKLTSTLTKREASVLR